MKSLERRILRLEGLDHYARGPSSGRRQRFPVGPPRIRFGEVTQHLPKSYAGERHLVITKYIPELNGHEWVEYAEVPGPKPPAPSSDPHLPRYLDIVFVGPEDEPRIHKNA